MSLRFQRLLIILFSLIFLTSAVLLILINSKKNLIYFYTPTELLSSDKNINDIVRIGGFVKKGSFKNLDEDNYQFIITDNAGSVKITYNGILPDLFREGQGAVVQGILTKENHIIASSVFAKHDENYIPANLKEQLKKSEYWKKEYE